MVAVAGLGKMPPLCLSSAWGFFSVQVDTGVRCVWVIERFVSASFLIFQMQLRAQKLVLWVFLPWSHHCSCGSRTRWELLPALPCRSWSHPPCRLLYTTWTHKALPCIIFIVIIIFFINKILLICWNKNAVCIYKYLLDPTLHFLKP